MNDNARSMLMRDYFDWHAANAPKGFGPHYDGDVRRVNRLNTTKWVWGAVGVVFGLTVINPNFTMRRSIYMRKIAPALMGTVGYMWGKK